MLVNNFLENSAVKYPEKIAITEGEGHYTYREIDQMANKVANALISEGLEKGDRVVIYLDNSLEAVASMFGVLKAGGVFLMINPSTKTEKLIYILNNCRAAVLIGPNGKLPLISEACNNTPSIRSVFLTGENKVSAQLLHKKCFYFNEILSGNEIHQPILRTIDVDLATIIYTSGSTGSPKGVMMAHFNMVSAANSITAYLANTPEDIVLNVLPLSFDYGLYQVLMSFMVGATVILEKSFIYPYKVIDILLKERVTGFPIVPTISAIILQMEDIKKNNFEHLRYITNTAAALPLSHIMKLRDSFPNAAIYSMYGLTECKRVSFLPPDQLNIRPNSVGKGMPNEEVYIVDEDGNRLRPGVVGELVIRGSNIMRGYWEMPEETAKRLRPGVYPGEMVLYSGDLFSMDEEGYLYFVSRKDDIIKSRGEKVSPKEIENVLYEMDDIVEAAVVGLHDDILGQAIKAYVVLKDSSALTEKEIIRFCTQHLEDFMVPKHVEFRSELPKTDTGKIKKTDLA